MKITITGVSKSTGTQVQGLSDFTNPRIGEIGESLNLGTCAFGHAGDGNLHVQVLFDEEEEMESVQKAIDQIFAETLKLGGTITGEHGVGIAKQKYLAWEQGPREVPAPKRGIFVSQCQRHAHP